MKNIAAQQNQVMQQRRYVEYVKSDYVNDKTVCKISISVRDADERIAAHYAGKHYTCRFSPPGVNRGGGPLLPPRRQWIDLLGNAPTHLTVGAAPREHSAKVRFDRLLARG